MQNSLLCTCLVLFSVQAFSQTRDTVRENFDYRKGKNLALDQDNQPEKVRATNRYFSLQANQLLRQLFSFSNSSAVTPNPYALTFSFNNKQTGSGLAFGLGYSTRHVEDNDQGNNRETDESNIDFRFGYDKKANISKRWIAGWGFDLLLNRINDVTVVDQGGFTSEVKSKGFGWGLGPRGMLLFQINEKIYLGTEASWYFKKSKIDSEIAFLGGGNQKSDVKESSFSLQVPTAIFLTMKF
jgi:hypothetical protein